MIPVQVVGLGMSPVDLASKAQEIIREAQVLVGGRWLLDYFPQHRALKIPLSKAAARKSGPLSGKLCGT
jgi:precorrin-6B methylase 1